MNVCREFREHLFEFLTGDAEHDKRRDYLSHWSDCPLCQEELKTAQKVWNSLDNYEEAIVPQTLREKTIARVYAEAQKEEVQATHIADRMGRLSFGRVLAATVAGITFALIFIFMLGQKVDSQPLTEEQLLALGTLWSGFLITGFCWLLGKFQVKSLKLSASAAFAIAATFLVMVGTYLCPDTTAYGWWKSTALGSQIQSSFGNVGSCFIFGILYVLPVALLISPVFRNQFKGVLVNNSLFTGAVCVLLLLPAIYIQCAYLAKGFMFSWIGGSFIGAFSGILGGVGVWSLRQRPPLTNPT